MLPENWRKLFSSVILRRGEDYYFEGKVRLVSEEADKVSAVVAGTNLYRVEIEFEDEEIKVIGCSCPYGEEDHCKHMAAVLLALENKSYDDDLNDDYFPEEEYEKYFDDDFLIEDFFDDDDDMEYIKVVPEKTRSPFKVEELVSNASEEKIRKFLTETLQRDEKLFTRFQVFISDKVSGSLLDQLKARIDDIIDDAEDYSGYINYHKSCSLYNDIIDLFNCEIDDLLDKGEYGVVFQLSIYLYGEIKELDIDDSNGIITTLLDLCGDVWDIILLHSKDELLETKMFQWFTDRLDKEDFLSDFIESFLMQYFKKYVYLQKKARIADEKIQYYIDLGGWTSRFNLSRWVLYRIGLLKDMKEDEEKQKQLIQKHWEIPDVRKYYICECMNKDDFSEALKVLEESREMDKDLPGHYQYYTDQIIEIYKQQGNSSAYRDELCNTVHNPSIFNLDYYMMLKDCFETAEWEQRREEILSDIKNIDLLNEIYELESMYDRLLDSLRRKSSVYTLDKYEGALKKHYPEEILNLYKECVVQSTIHASSRKKYREIVHYLNKMMSYPHGKKVVQCLVDEWKTTYKRRKAMLDELSSLKL